MKKLWINLVAALMIFVGASHLTGKAASSQLTPAPIAAEKVYWCTGPAGWGGCECWSADGDYCWGDWCQAGWDWCTSGAY
ncbi:MAG TPA: hypothetical protein VNP72_02405 [Longimicrobium sp.]|nr:hypothetical protein [Longimicrobium sp.]